MTLTVTEIAYYRRASSDTKASISTDQIQAFYDKAVTFGEDADTTEARTIVYMIRLLIADAAVLVDLGGQIETEKQSQWFDHLKEVLLPMYEELAGMVRSGGGLSVGVLNLGLDATEDDL